jgi:ABC-type branched-subunit amino acid transport system ATPase component
MMLAVDEFLAGTALFKGLPPDAAERLSEIARRRELSRGDEPSIGLDPRSRALVFGAIGTLAASGRTVLLVEQNARSGLAAAQVGAVLESGVVRLVRAADQLLSDPEVARLYLGARPVPAE